MSEADDTSTTVPNPSGRVPDCAARLATLHQLKEEEADDPDEDDALVPARNAAEQVAVAALVAAPARTPGELAGKCEWMARLIAERASGCMMDVLHDVVAAVARDARAIAAAAAR